AAALKVPEQVADLGLSQLFEQSVGHEREVRRLDGLDRSPRNGGLLMVGVDQGEQTIVLVHDQAGQHAANAERDGLGLIFLADERAGVDQAGQQEVEIAAIGAGQIRADRLAIAEKLVANRTVFLEEGFAAKGTALVALRQKAADLGDSLLLLGRAGPGHLAPQGFEPIEQRWIGKLSDALNMSWR